jgi:hypothetical protein
MHLTNIVPRETDELDIPAYNSFALQFYKDFRGWKPKNVSITCTSQDCELKDVISGKKTRSFFESYLSHYPTTFHPSDIYNLDVFICAAHRFSKSRVDTHRLFQYLTEKLSWDKKHAELCCSRIDAGLDILKVNRRF